MRSAAGQPVLDFPDLAVGANHLYLTTNIFQGTDQAGSGVVRIPFDEIGSGAITAKDRFAAAPRRMVASGVTALGAALVALAPRFVVGRFLLGFRGI